LTLIVSVVGVETKNRKTLGMNYGGILDFGKKIQEKKVVSLFGVFVLVLLIIGVMRHLTNWHKNFPKPHQMPYNSLIRNSRIANEHYYETIL